MDEMRQISTNSVYSVLLYLCAYIRFVHLCAYACEFVMYVIVFKVIDMEHSKPTVWLIEEINVEKQPFS